MAKEKSPAFQFYPKEFLTDGNVAAMSLQECGAYIKLICLCWQEDSLPLDPQRLANMVGVAAPVFQKLWPALEVCFVVVDGRIRHNRLDAERQKQEAFRQRQSLKGQASAAARATVLQPGPTQGPTGGQPTSNRGSAGIQPDGQPKVNSPISDLRRSTYTHKGGRGRPDELSGTTDPILARQAGDFIERFTELYKRELRGAIYYHKGSLDFGRVCKLLRTFDPLRLERLAVVFLRTDEKFIARTDRGLGVFESQVNWCEQRLRLVEAKAADDKFPRSA